MNRAYRYRIYPTKEQMHLFNRTFGCCRKTWNLMLGNKISSYENTGSFGMQTPAQYKKAYPYLKEVDSLALCNVQLQLQKAVRDCCLNKRHFRFPKFKSKKHCRKFSYTTNHVELSENGIRLPKAGIVKAGIHRPVPEGWKIKSATVTREPDGKYYASVLLEYEQELVEAASGKAIGLDYKVNGLYAGSDGNSAGMPAYYRKSQAKLGKAQHKLSRKKKGSRNYQKQLLRVNRIHAKAKNQRSDFLHKLSRGITNRYSTVCVEDLNLKAMSNKGFHNGKSVMDTGYGMFLWMLSYKLPERGGKLVKVDKWFPSSQLCSRCGSMHPEMKDLRIRMMSCSCGLHLDRDVNAAVNILHEGLRTAAAG